MNHMLNRVAEATYPALISSDVCQFMASIDVKRTIYPVSSPTASIRLSGHISILEQCVVYHGLVRFVRGRERNGGGSTRKFQIRNCCPFGEVAMEALPYLHLHL